MGSQAIFSKTSMPIPNTEAMKMIDDKERAALEVLRSAGIDVWRPR